MYPGTSQPGNMIYPGTSQPGNAMHPRTIQPGNVISPGTSHPGNMMYTGTIQPGNMMYPGINPPLNEMYTRPNQPGNVHYNASHPNVTFQMNPSQVPVVASGNQGNFVQGAGGNQFMMVNLPKRMPSKLIYYPKHQILVLGIIQIICGVSSIILAGISISKTTYLYFIGHGFWCGLLAIAAGILGVFSSCKISKCSVTAQAVLSMLTVLIVQCQIYIEITSSVFDSYGLNRVSSPDPLSGIQTSVALICFGFIEVAAAFWASMIGCHFTCCCNCCANCCCPCYSPKKSRKVSSNNPVWVQVSSGQQQIIQNNPTGNPNLKNVYTHLQTYSPEYETLDDENFTSRFDTDQAYDTQLHAHGYDTRLHDHGYDTTLHDHGYDTRINKDSDSGYYQQLNEPDV